MYCGDDNYYESWYYLIQAWKTEPESEEEIQARKIGKKWREKEVLKKLKENGL